MKTPGILYRISFLVILSSLFIFAAVTYVSYENTQARIDRLIAYKFDFVAEHFRAELEGNHAAAPILGEGAETDSNHLKDILNRSQRCLKGLAGLTLLEARHDKDSYAVSASSFRDGLGGSAHQLAEMIAGSVIRRQLLVTGVQVGEPVSLDAEKFKTIYIPTEPLKADHILAITFIPSEIARGDYSYTYTLMLLFLGTTLITLLIINFLFRKFVRPLQHLVRGMEKTAEGEVLYKIEDVTDDEMGRVATAFNTMSATLWDKQRQLTASNQNLTATLEQLSQAHTSLAESEALLSRLVENAPFAIIATDVNRKILIFSHAASETFDISVGNAIGRDIREFFPFTPEKVFPASGREGERLQEEMICQKQDGENFPVLVSRVPIRDHEGNVGAYLFIIRDISESKSFTEMMVSIDRMATRGVMAGEIAHEINNYLAIILGNVELLPLLLSKGKMDKVDHKLEVLRTTVTKIQKFSEGLMGYGNEEAVFEPGDLNQLIENLVAFLRPQNRYDDIRFSLTPSPRIPLVEFDNCQMQQLLVNLLNNAADALREKPGERLIDINTELIDDGKSVRVTMRDNAGGLPEDLADVIFEARYNGKRRGRGFGLLIVKRIIDKHNGTVDYESIPGDGTVFILTIPVKRVRTMEETPAAVPDKVTT